MSRPVRFTATDITRAMSGAAKAGYRVRIEIKPTGEMVITPIDETERVTADRTYWDRKLGGQSPIALRPAAPRSRRKGTPGE